MIIDPQWLAIARPLVGLEEIPGPQHAPEILAMWRAIKRSGIQSDEVPWCAAFVGACLERAGIRSSRFESAASYLKWGVRLDGPAHGCIVVFSREGGGHVGFVVGRDEGGKLLVLGGNQGDSVSVKAFPQGRVTGYRWPVDVHIPSVPLQIGSAETSQSEA
ncbi:MAG: TIGR02594 family protein [Rhodocyclales bacterium]|nr:TIGR02594 family protein [Rhodocyclales bacterium]